MLTGFEIFPYYTAIKVVCQAFLSKYDKFRKICATCICVEIFTIFLCNMHNFKTHVFTRKSDVFHRFFAVPAKDFHKISRKYFNFEIQKDTKKAIKTEKNNDFRVSEGLFCVLYKIYKTRKILNMKPIGRECEKQVIFI